MSKQLRLPFAVSKAKFQTFFVNEAGTPLSMTTFRKYSQLKEFCETELNISAAVFRRRKNFFGHEVTAICEKYGIEIEELIN